MNDYIPTKIKYSYNFNTGFTPDTSDKDSYSRNQEGHIWVTISDLNTKYITNSCQKLTDKGVKGKQNQIVKKGNLLFSFKLSVGKVAFAGCDFYTNEAIANFSSVKNDLRYLFYAAPYFIVKNSNVNIYGAKILNQELIKNAKIPLPSIEKQIAIANFLDLKFSKIDRQINVLKDEVQELKNFKQSIINKACICGLHSDVALKYSGHNWIGNIPSHWIVDKFNRICSIITDYVASGSFADLNKNVVYKDKEDYALLVRTTDLSNKNKNDSFVYVDKHSYEFLSNSNLFGGEVVLPNIGASIGDVYMVPKLYSKMTLGPNAIMIKSNYNDKYYFYLFSTEQFRNKLIDMGLSAAQSKFNKTNFRQLRGLIPPLAEQNEIVEFLDYKIEIIDKLIESKVSMISEYSKLKESLAYEYVSGLKEVN